MTKPLNVAAIASALMATACSAVAQTTTTTTTKKSPSAVTTTTKTTTQKSTHTSTANSATRRHVVVRESATEVQIRALRTEMQAQIDDLKRQIGERDTRLADAQTAVSVAQSQAIAAASKTAQLDTLTEQNTALIQSLQNTVGDLQIANNGLTQTVIANKTDLQEQIESPAALHYKGVTITPVAFFALESVYRTRALNSDVNTPFNSIPYSGANEAHVSEFNFSGRQSRLGGLFEGNAGKFKLGGYFEADFLSSGTTSNANQSNSFTLRQRQIWGQAATAGGFTVTGGQMWSLVTETGKSTDNRTEKLPNTVDAQYMVGFNWARQPALRVQQKFGNTFFGTGSALTLAASLEEAQITNYNATNAPNNFYFNGPGQNGGLLNAFNGTPTNNLAPDVVLKAALDLPHSHYEVGGIARFFRDRIYPAVVTTAVGTGNATPGGIPKNDTEYAGGVFANARVSPSHFVDLAVSVMAGDGVGRYGSAQLADATVRPTGKLEPLRNYHTLVSVETHPTKKLDFYGYAGGEYVQRTYYPTGVSASPYTGYAPPNVALTNCLVETPVSSAATGGSITPAGTCGAQTRDIFEGTAGATYRIYSSPKFGRLQYQVVYSYLTKNAWTGLLSGTFATPSAVFYAPKATENMVFTGMRYYIP